MKGCNACQQEFCLLEVKNPFILATTLIADILHEKRKLMIKGSVETKNMYEISSHSVLDFVISV